MQVTDVRVKLHKSENRLRGVASVTFDNAFVVHYIKIIEGERGIFIAMPSIKTNSDVKKPNYIDIAHPINTETRTMIENAIIETYKEIVERARLNEEKKQAQLEEDSQTETESQTNEEDSSEE
ncbi:septation regulator SpoVG [Italian clover phyllody phytoplasma]|uniref:septation regulator SpoVG n=1 Tax=Italian clover phyllody phytoplasma TaxID=1196420 RepID=UPI0002E49239|nr:septation regulator SpoVG [Italian clover phyllody phytoplasma]